MCRDFWLFWVKVMTYPLTLGFYWTRYMRICFMRALTGTKVSHITRSACIMKKIFIGEVRYVTHSMIVWRTEYYWWRKVLHSTVWFGKYFKQNLRIFIRKKLTFQLIIFRASLICTPTTCVTINKLYWLKNGISFTKLFSGRRFIK